MLRIHFIPRSRQLFAVEVKHPRQTDKWWMSGEIEKFKQGHLIELAISTRANI